MTDYIFPAIIIIWCALWIWGAERAIGRHKDWFVGICCYIIALTPIGLLVGLIMIIISTT